MGILDFIKVEKPKSASVEDPIAGYQLTDLYKDIKVDRNSVIPEGTQIGSRLVLIHNAADKYTNENIALMLVPQRKIFGYINDDKAFKHIVYSLKQSDQVVARISYFSKKKYENEATVNIAFFKKTK